MEKTKKIIISITSIVFISALSLYIYFNQKKPLPIVIESDNIRIIEKFINPEDHPNKTLIVFDIDNTLAEITSDLGSDQWFYGMVNKIEKKGFSYDQAVEKILPTLYLLHETLTLKPVEHETPFFVNSLQTRGFNVIALTARSLPLTQVTAKQLKNIHIDLSKNSFCPVDINLSVKYPAVCLHGIIFSGLNNKGKVLVHLFELMQYWPSKIIFVDDKMKNIKDVEREVIKHNIPFIGIRYNRLDQKVENFKLDTTEQELIEFYKVHPEIVPAIG